MKGDVFHYGIVPTAVVLLIALSGCAAVTEELKPVPSASSLVGKWKGVWGGNMVHPIELVVENQREGKVAGTMTSLLEGTTATHRMSGTVGAKPDGTLWVILTVSGPSTWVFPLKVISGQRLEGMGHSPRHSGPVTLTRE